jgi:hypothetical protein
MGGRQKHFTRQGQAEEFNIMNSFVFLTHPPIPPFTLKKPGAFPLFGAKAIATLKKTGKLSTLSLAIFHNQRYKMKEVCKAARVTLQRR